MNELFRGIAAFGSSFWGDLGASGARVTMIIIAAWVLMHVVRRVLSLAKDQLKRGITDPELLKRRETIGAVLGYFSTVLISVLTVLLILSELGIAIAPILGAAGVAGIAVGIGAQSLVKDYFNGIFLLLENQLRQGDVVTVADKSGLVEDVTLRYVRLRDYDGNVHYVPNSLITTVTNRTRDHACAVIDISIASREDVDEALESMRQVGQAMREDEEFGATILADLEIAGLEQWNQTQVTLRCRFTVVPLSQWSVRREFLRRLKKAFDARGIEVPQHNVTALGAAAKAVAGRAPTGSPFGPVELDRKPAAPAA